MDTNQHKNPHAPDCHSQVPGNPVGVLIDKRTGKCVSCGAQIGPNHGLIDDRLDHVEAQLAALTARVTALEND
jgi:hypothetical protein